MISKFINKIEDEDLKENVIYGLAFGLVVGLVFGLVYVLVFGLVFGLAYGLADGLADGLVFGLVFGIAFVLAFGLVVGLVFGLVSGLVFGLAVGLANFSQLCFGLSIMPFAIITAIIVLLLAEFVFFNGRGYRKGSKFWFTAYRKGEALLESLIVCVNLLNLRWIIKNINIPWDGILKWIGYIGAGAIALAMTAGLLYLWIKANERRVTK